MGYWSVNNNLGCFELYSEFADIKFFFFAP